MNAVLTVPGFPFVSGLLSDLFQQFQHTGLLSQDIAMPASALNKMKARLLILEACVKAVEEVAGPISVSGVPCIYNVDKWSEKRLCGYAGIDITVKPDELLASYLASWITGSNAREVFQTHIRRNLLWYYAQNRSFESALNLLLDLFSAGFIRSIMVFRDILGSLAEVYAMNIDVSSLRDTDISDRGRINEGLTVIRTLLRDGQQVQDRTLSIVDALIDSAADRIEHARCSETFDEWIVRLAQLWGPVWSLTTMMAPIAGPYMTPLQRAVVPQMEEIAADLLAFFSPMRFFLSYRLAPTLPLPTEELAGVYFEKYGSTWLQRLASDRLMLPNKAVIDIQNQTENGAITPASITVPEDWDLYSELADPLFTAFESEGAYIRTEGFEWNLLLEVSKHLGWIPAEDKSERPPDELLVNAREQLARAEVQSFSTRAETVEVAVALYPWNSDIRANYAESLWLDDQKEGALEQARQAVLLEIRSPQHWNLLAHVCPDTEAEVLRSMSKSVTKLVEDAQSKLAAMKR
jgi:hypothetical protein